MAFKSCAPFTECIPNIDGTTIDDAEELDLVMPIYNLVECSSNFSDTTGSLLFYSKGKETGFDADIVDINAFKLFRFKAKLLENTVADGNNSILKMQQLPCH